MKRLKLISACLLCTTILSACGNANTQQTSSAASASQDEFLQAMAAGISARLADNTDETNMTEEQKAELFQNLVDTELAQIDKYDDVIFEDDKFNSLAHEYINACHSQKLATEYYKNTTMYNALWDSGRNIRAAIISYLYENYELPITSEQAAEYNTTGSVSYTVDSDTANFFNAFNDDGEVQLSQGDLNIVGTTRKRNEVFDDTYFEFSYLVKNKSSATLNSIDVNCSILDKDENIVGTTSANVTATIAPNKTATCSGSITLNDYPTAQFIRIDNVDYDGNNNHIVTTLPVDSSEISKYMISIL